MCMCVCVCVLHKLGFLLILILPFDSLCIPILILLRIVLAESQVFYYNKSFNAITTKKKKTRHFNEILLEGQLILNRWL